MGDSNERLRLAREKAGFKSASAAAKRFGWTVSTYASHENGQTPTIPQKWAEEYARRFKANLVWLITGQGTADGSTSTVPVMGRVGAGSVIDPEFDQVPEDGLFAVDLPFPVPDEMIGLEVDGESMYPKYDPGDVVVVRREQRRETNFFIGKLAAVRTADNRRYLKTILRGTKTGLYRLESFNAKPIEDVEIAWVGEIHVIVPAEQVRHIGIAKKVAASRKAAARAKLSADMDELPLAPTKRKALR